MKSRLLIALCCFLASLSAEYGQAVLKPSDRVIFVGDSITGQGANMPRGWERLVVEEFQAIHPEAKPVFVALGGSGQGVGAWLSTERKSRDVAAILDVPGVDARAELGQPADVVVCMLGMNDALRPQVIDDPAGYEAWASAYRDLIHALRARVHPRVFALATPTLCTEDPQSPKNRVLDRLVEKLGALATEEGCLLLPTRQAMREMLDAGRSHQSDFHVLRDNVHPNQAGHVAIAVGMLRGLGEGEAAAALLRTWTPQLWTTPSLSYRLSVLETDAAGRDRFQVSYSYDSGKTESEAVKATLAVPDGWTASLTESSAFTGTFLVTGRPDRLTNTLLLEANGKQVQVSIPAPWMIGSSREVRNGWQATGYLPDQGRLDADALLAGGKGWGTGLEIVPGKPLAWTRYFAGVDYGGAGAPGAIDFAAVRYFDNFAVGYGARWIFCDVAKPVRIRVVPLGFSRDNYVTVWMNGQQVFSGDTKHGEATPADVQLQKGWNLLAFKSNHREWQWQFAIDLLPAPGQPIDDLRFRATPPEQSGQN